MSIKKVNNNKTILYKHKNFKHTKVTACLNRGLLDYTTIISPLSNSSFIQYCDSNIGLSLLLPIKLSLFQLLRQQ